MSGDMYARFQIWQQNPRTVLEVEGGDENTFIVDDPSVDVRFTLKGYGFKKSGETNRIIQHFGCYRCFFRKVGDTDFTLFAHVVVQRDSQESVDVYADVGATSGLIDRARYEIKIFACRLVELEAWSGGVVEGIASGDRFYSDLAARQQRATRARVDEPVTIEEDVFLGFKGETNSDGTAKSTFDGIEKVDNLTVLVHLSRQDSDLLSNLSLLPFSMVSTDALSSEGDNYGSLGSVIAGTGPYMVSSFSGDTLVLTPNSDFRGEVPSDDVEFPLG